MMRQGTMTAGWRGAAFSLAVPVVALGAGCNDGLLPGDVPPPPIVWSGEHVRVGTELDLEQWCAGSLPHLDDYTGALKEVFGAPDGVDIVYYLFESPISEVGVCPSHAAACAITDDDGRGVVVTDDLPDDHEVVHALGLAAGRTMPHFFDEGAATYWGGMRASVSTDFRDLDIHEILDAHWEGEMERREYVLAAHFTSYLVHTEGLEPYMALRDASTWTQSRRDFERVFADVMGLTLDEALDGYADWPYCDYESIRSSFFECGAEPDHTVPIDGELTIELDVSCSSPGVLGPRRLEDEATKIWRGIVVDVQDPSQYVVFEDPALGVTNTVAVEIKRCATACDEVWTNSRTLRPRGTPQQPDFFVFDLLPGRYAVRVSRDADDPGPVRFRWE